MNTGLPRLFVLIIEDLAFNREENIMEKENLTGLGQKMTISSEKKKKIINWITDLIDFKIMIFPFIVKFIYILTLVGIYLAILSPGKNSNFFLSFILFVVSCIPIAFVVHIFFEFIMLAFAMLDTQREIRDELKKLNGHFEKVKISTSGDASDENR